MSPSPMAVERLTPDELTIWATALVEWALRSAPSVGVCRVIYAMAELGIQSADAVTELDTVRLTEYVTPNSGPRGMHAVHVSIGLLARHLGGSLASETERYATLPFRVTKAQGKKEWTLTITRVVAEALHDAIMMVDRRMGMR